MQTVISPYGLSQPKPTTDFDPGENKTVLLLICTTKTREEILMTFCQNYLHPEQHLFMRYHTKGCQATAKQRTKATQSYETTGVQVLYEA
jgi:hypothetical protein